jgi:tetratricopeptide (TPR) repeat protein
MKTLITRSFSACILLQMIGTPTFAAESSTGYMEKALKARSKGQYSTAVDTLRLAISAAQRANQKSLARFMLGDCLMELKKPLEAKAIFDEIISDSPGQDEEAEARFRLAQCHAMMGEHDRMKELCQELVNRFPDTPYAELAKFLQKSGRVKVAAIVTAPTSDSKTSEPLEGKADAEGVVKAEPLGKSHTPPTTPPEPTKPIAPVRVATSEPNEPAVASRDPRTPAPIRIEPGSGKVTAVTPNSDLTTRVSVTTPRSPSPSSPPPAPTPGSSTQVTIPSVKAPTDLLVFAPLSQTRREEVATDILKDQTLMTQQARADNIDEIMFRLASRTAQFGEHLEACKLYDKLLTSHPSSRFVEPAYFEAIRLRAMLKAFSAVITWGDSFQKTFPDSKLSGGVTRLMEYARAMAKAKSAAPRKPAKPVPQASQTELSQHTERLEQSSESEALRQDPTFREGKRLMKAEKYRLALANFSRLAATYSRVPLIWWDMALVQMQLQQHDDAERSLQTLLQLDPQSEEARSLLGYVHYQQKDYRQAAADYRQTGDADAADGLDFFDSGAAANRLEKTGKTTRSATQKRGEKL